MLKNLLTTALLQMGVATATPVYNAENTANYTLNLTQTYINTVSSQYEAINNTTELTYDTGTINDIRYNITGGNAYINIVGNQYKTIVYNDSVNPDTDIYYYRTYQDRANVNQTYASGHIVIVLKVTPYNYNVNTSINLTVQLDLRGAYDPNIFDSLYVNNAYMQRNMYTTVQENWDTYIDRQPTKKITSTIINDIEDVNNNFYYEKQENLKTLTTTGNDDYSYIDNFNVNIVPKSDNYIVLDYVPLVDAYRYDGDEQYTYYWANYMAENSLWTINQLSLTGTNIIPSSSYEVIDIPGLMWQILTMPFAFVSQAFNLTLFPGTPYQLNISNLFLSIVAVIAFIWLITFILKMKG